MDMTRVTFLERNIDDKLWLKILIALTYIKNNYPTKTFPSNATLHKIQSQENTINISHLQVLDFTMYLFFHEEKQSKKSKKWAPRLLKELLVGYDGYTTHRVHIIDQNKVIQVKNLQIFKNFEIKPHISFQDYENKPTFEIFLLKDEKISKNRTTALLQLGQKVKNVENTKKPIKGKDQRLVPSQLNQKIENTENAKNLIIPFLAGQSYDTGNTKHTTGQLGQKVKNLRL